MNKGEENLLRYLLDNKKEVVSFDMLYNLGVISLECYDDFFKLKPDLFDIETGNEIFDMVMKKVELQKINETISELKAMSDEQLLQLKYDRQDRCGIFLNIKIVEMYDNELIIRKLK